MDVWNWRKDAGHAEPRPTASVAEPNTLGLSAEARGQNEATVCMNVRGTFGESLDPVAMFGGEVPLWFTEAAERCVRKGLVVREEGGRLRLTAAGLRLAQRALANLLV